MRSFTYTGALVLLTLSGCRIYGGQKKGENGTLGFYEPNAYPADSGSKGIGFERPIALGARADAWVLAPGISSLMSATVDDPEIVSLSLSVYPIVLHGLAEGSTKLHVATSSASDSLTLTVLRPDGAHVWHPAEEGLSFAVPDSFFGREAAYREGASLKVAAEPLAGGQPLLGFDLFEWTTDPTLLSHTTSGYLNTERFTALGVAGLAEISTQLGGSYNMITASASEVPTLKIYRQPPDLSQPFQITALAPEDIGNFLVGATDADGHYLVPGPKDSASFQVEVTSGTVVLLESNLTGHNVTLRACAGAGTIRLRYLGAEISAPIEVTAAVADAACT